MERSGNRERKRQSVATSLAEQAKTSPPPASSKAVQHSKYLFRTGLFVIVLIAYANSFNQGIVMDGKVLTSDPRVHSVDADTIHSIWRQTYWWPVPAARLYRPVTITSFLFNYAILGNGNTPVGYHVLNFVLHLINAWLVFALAFRLFQRHGPAFFTAALWAVHPVTTDSVTNVAGRSDLLAAVAVLAGLLIYARLLETVQVQLVLMAFALFLVALLGALSKENAVVLAGLMLLWDLTFSKQGWRERLVQRTVAYGAIGCALLIVFLIRLQVFSTLPWPRTLFVDNPIGGASFWSGRFTAIKIIGLDLWLLLWPLRLSVDYAYNQIPLSNFTSISAWVAVAIVCTILGVALARRKRDPLLFWGVGYFAITLLPVSNLLIPIGAAMAERFLYLPSIGFVVVIVVLVYRLRRRQIIYGILGVAIGLCVARTLIRNADWKDDFTLATADLHSAPNSFRLHQIVADTIYRQNDARAIDQVIQEAEKSWSILRALDNSLNYQQTPATLGLFYLTKADEAGASTQNVRAWNERALSILQTARGISETLEKAFDSDQLAHGKPLTQRVAYQPLYGYLGLAYARLGRYPEAIEACRYGIELDPSVPEMYRRLATIYHTMGNSRSEAVIALELLSIAKANGPTSDNFASIYGADSCAVISVQGKPKLNLECPVVHEDICEALADLIKHFEVARLEQTARLFRNAIKSNGCPAIR